MRDRLKRKTAKAKRKSYSEFEKGINREKGSQAAATINNVVKVGRRNARRNVTAPEADLDLSEFMEAVANKFPPKESYRGVEGQKFDVAGEFAEGIVEPIRTARSGKVVGYDQTFAEALRIKLNLATDFIISLWRTCGRLGVVLKTLPRVMLSRYTKKVTAGIP